MSVILFDLDGTLLDSTDAILEGFNRAFEVNGSPLPKREDVLALIGHPLDVMSRELGVEENKIEDHVVAYKEHYRTISKIKTEFLPNAKEAIELASTFATLGVVTTKTGKYSRELLEHMDVMKYFDVLIGREDVHHPKPHPEPILKAMHALEAKKEHTFMVGDTCLDMVSARDAGIKAVGVLCGYGKSEELKKCSNFVESDSLKAIQFIMKL